MYLFYSFVLTIGFLVLLPRFLWDWLRNGKYAAGFWQRLGYLPDFDPKGKPIVWLHCVSVGETNAAKPLVKAVQTNFPDYRLVVSTTTKTGQALAKEIFKKEAALVFYFPFDWIFVVRRVLKKIKPSVILIMETELWFNFLREAKRQNIQTVLVNGRLSEKSFKNYSLIRAFMRRVLKNLDLALMIGKADAEKLIGLGCEPEKVFVTGNLKFDLETAESDLTTILGQRFEIDNTRTLIIAASTHQPEESWILESFEILRRQFGEKGAPRLMIAPRHPERFAEVARLIEKSGFKFARRSDSQSDSDAEAEVILLDSIGELRAVYPLAEIVFVGGSLIPHGGQNILEPAATNRAIVTGYYTMNFASIIKAFVEKNAVVQLPELEESVITENLARVFFELLNDERERKTLAKNAFAVLFENRGATAKTIAKLQQIFNKRA